MVIFALMSSQYKHLFFDLDKTLYDFHKSSRETLEEVYRNHNLAARGITNFDEFLNIYTEINLKLWEIYRRGEIEKKALNVKRFALSLKAFQIDDPDLASEIAKYYVTESPLKKALFPGVIETLEKLHGHYNMHIITNGFEEVQHIKIKAQGIGKYFDTIITSEEAGVKKPDPYIFEYALKKAGASANESLMIGDDLEVDIIGAREAGIDQVYVNYPRISHNEKISFEIFSFSELMGFLPAIP